MSAIYLPRRRVNANPKVRTAVSASSFNCVLAYLSAPVELPYDLVTNQKFEHRSSDYAARQSPSPECSAHNFYSARSGFVSPRGVVDRISDLSTKFLVVSGFQPFSFMWAGYPFPTRTGTLMGRQFNYGDTRRGEWSISRETSNRIRFSFDSSVAGGEVANTSGDDAFYRDGFNVVAGRYSDGTISIYVNSKQVISVTGITPSAVAGDFALGRDFFLGSNEGAFSNCSGTRVVAAAVFDKFVPDAALKSLSTNPWQIFQDPARRTIFLPAAVGGNAVTPYYYTNLLARGSN